MSLENHITRRQLLAAAMAGASSIVAGQILQGGEPMPSAPASTTPPDPKIRGPFLILSTPFTEKGEVDYEVLAKEARFMDWCGCPGMIWPQSGDSVDLLTKEEKLQGMEVLAKAARGFHSALCLGVQGKNTAEMLLFAKHAEKLAPTAIISRPPDEGKTEDDLRQYWRALASVSKRPVFFQTTGGVAYKGPIPSVKLLTELVKESPYFGYIKEEAGDILGRIRALVAARPPIRRVFAGHGAIGWLHEWHLGAEGVITERAVYADVFARLWEAQQRGDHATVRDIYSKFLLMLNFTENLGGLRGAQLYLWKKRGVFKTMVSRHYGKDNAIPSSPKFSELKLAKDVVAEIDYRFEALKPYLKQETPALD